MKLRRKSSRRKNQNVKKIMKILKNAEGEPGRWVCEDCGFDVMSVVDFWKHISRTGHMGWGRWKSN